MGRRGPTKHLKRINVPKHWMLDKLGGIFVSFFLRLRERALVFVACLGEGNCLGSGGGARGLLRTRGLSGAARRSRLRARASEVEPRLHDRCALRVHSHRRWKRTPPFAPTTPLARRTTNARARAQWDTERERERVIVPRLCPSSLDLTFSRFFVFSFFRANLAGPQAIPWPPQDQRVLAAHLDLA